MRFGIALPNQVAGATQQDLAGFIERAERLGLDSVWTIDRLVYGGLASLPLLAWAAGQTKRLTVGTSVLLAPLYSPLVLAKEVATLDMLSGGRMILGLGAGARADDYQAAAIPMVLVSFGYANSPLDALRAAARIDHFDELEAQVTTLLNGLSANA